MAKTYDKPIMVRLPAVLLNLIENEALAGCADRSKIIRKALRHYFNCGHARRYARSGAPRARGDQRTESPSNGLEGVSGGLVLQKGRGAPADLPALDVDGLELPAVDMEALELPAIDHDALTVDAAVSTPRKTPKGGDPSGQVFNRQPILNGEP